MKNRHEFLSLLIPYRKKIFFAFIAILITNLSGLVFPWSIKIIIDDVLVPKNVLLLNTLAIGLVFVFILKAGSGYLCEYLISWVGENAVCDLRNRILWHLQRLSVKYIENTSTGKIISSVIGDVESIKKLLFGGALDFIYSFFNVIFVLTILLIVDWRLTLVSLIFLPAFGFTFFKLTPRLQEKHREVRDKYAELTSGINEVFNGIRIITGFAKNEYEAARLNARQKEIVKASLYSHRLAIALWTGSEFISSLGLVTLLWFGSRAVFSGGISAGGLVAFYSYLGMLFSPVIKMVIINNYYQEAAASLRRINEILSEEPKVQEAGHPVSLHRIKGNIEFRGVSFSYDNNKEVLSEIDLEAGESEVIALVGKSGAGKTTLINLLLRFYDPGKGAIFIDGHNLKTLDLRTYRSRMAMVLQDDYLFSASIRENILYSKSDADETEVIQAAQLANAHQFILELPRGYDTGIGERGVKLSYGQRQRISIARAILRSPAILILDEATSCVDSETERLIIEGAYKNVIRGRTTFIIAHRLSAITYADKIVFIEDGRIAETGSHFQLLEKRGRYWRMWRQQAGSTDYDFQASKALT